MRGMEIIPEAVQIDARAKIMWGEGEQKTLEFLQSKGIGDKDAYVFIQNLLKEREASVREDGRKKIIIGAACMPLPAIYYFVTHYCLGYWDVKFFAGLIVVAVFGLTKFLNGLSMVLRPRKHSGSLANAE